MSRGSNEAGDSSEFVYPPLKKPKENPVPEAEAKAKVDAKVHVGMRILRKGDWDDPEYKRQRDIFEEQFESSEVIFFYYILFWICMNPPNLLSGNDL